MGLGMGSTMMPIMSSALATLTDHTIARGSTLMNIVQQVAASIGTAVFSVLLTNGIKDIRRPAGRPGVHRRDGVEVYAGVFLVGDDPGRACLIPAFLLPRKKTAAPVDQAVLVNH